MLPLLGLADRELAADVAVLETGLSCGDPKVNEGEWENMHETTCGANNKNVAATLIISTSSETMKGTVEWRVVRILLELKWIYTIKAEFLQIQFPTYTVCNGELICLHTQHIPEERSGFPTQVQQLNQQQQWRATSYMATIYNMFGFTEKYEPSHSFSLSPYPEFSFPLHLTRLVHIRL